MKKFIKDYLKLIAYAITGLVFVLASFYLMMNYNHNEELKQNIFIGPNEVYYETHQEILSNINKNLTTFRSKKNTTAAYKQIANSLEQCYSILDGKNSFSKIETNKEYTPYDIYKIGSSFQNNVMNLCWNGNLGYLRAQNTETTTESNNENLENQIKVPEKVELVLPILSKYVATLNDNVSDSLKEIENNSSYFYTTNITSATIRNYLGSDYTTIAKSYNDFASIILYLTEIINENEVVTNG